MPWVCTCGQRNIVDGLSCLACDRMPDDGVVEATVELAFVPTRTGGSRFRDEVDEDIDDQAEAEAEAASESIAAAGRRFRFTAEDDEVEEEAAPVEAPVAAAVEEVGVPVLAGPADIFADAVSETVVEFEPETVFESEEDPWALWNRLADQAEAEAASPPQVEAIRKADTSTCRFGNHEIKASAESLDTDATRRRDPWAELRGVYAEPEDFDEIANELSPEPEPEPAVAHVMPTPAVEEPHAEEPHAKEPHAEEPHAESHTPKSHTPTNSTLQHHSS